MTGNTLGRYVANGRDNNFNLIRFLAAFAVLFSHSFALAVGTGKAEPLRQSLGMTPGTMAVDVFFITSGFLVTRSLLLRKSVSDFLLARILRIYPGLIVSVAVTVLLCGLAFHPGSLGSFLTDDQTLAFLYRNSCSLVSPMASLPGVFEDNPFRHAVNGSLWTLPIELRMYGSLILVWLLFLCFRKWCPARVEWLFTAVPVVALFLYWRENGLSFQEQSHLRLMFLFYAGGLYYLFRDRVPLTWPLFTLLAVSVLATAACGSRFFFPAYLAALPYLTLFGAYVPAGHIREFNRIGDYSFGIYIYAFPVQQAIVSILHPVSAAGLFFLSALVTSLLAFLSWHLVEKNSLSLKNRSLFAAKAPPWPALASKPR